MVKKIGNLKFFLLYKSTMLWIGKYLEKIANEEYLNSEEDEHAVYLQVELFEFENLYQREEIERAILINMLKDIRVLDSLGKGELGNTLEVKFIPYGEARLKHYEHPTK